MNDVPLRHIPLVHLVRESIRSKVKENPKMSHGEALQAVINDWPELVHKLDNDILTCLDEELRAAFLSKLVDLKMEEKKSLSFSMAFSEVQKEYPELTLLYVRDIDKQRER